MNEFVIVMTAAGTQENADLISRTLVQEKLAACVQQQQIRSHYVWKDETYEEPETLLLIKTRAALAADVEARVKALHTYQLPEITVTPILSASAEYAGWLRTNTGL